MTPPRTLTDMMAEVHSRARDWSLRQDLGFEPAAVGAAWMASDDPVAMLLLLAALHPKRDVEKCFELATAMSFFEPMRAHAHTMNGCRPGMNFNGTSLFYFIRLYTRLRSALQVFEGAERSELDSKLAAAIRAVVPDPFTLARPTA
ncbi:hypothetical protein [Corallococcus aberystwythensis]|uniref:Uncharacterized protein n=1 Tax=Corallococcus aberystwythensis TaxID=2316722 RepID=A0A3A8PH12_9BACT|nr:hypothetical protein [Corallococcus aberystwythensis]RKH55633.1 hypothetical protein D7W81_35845 [Corallococcus aberystwythensis]